MMSVNVHFKQKFQQRVTKSLDFDSLSFSYIRFQEFNCNIIKKRTKMSCVPIIIISHGCPDQLTFLCGTWLFGCLKYFLN